MHIPNVFPRILSESLYKQYVIPPVSINSEKGSAFSGSKSPLCINFLTCLARFFLWLQRNSELSSTTQTFTQKKKSSNLQVQFKSITFYDKVVIYYLGTKKVHDAENSGKGTKEVHTVWQIKISMQKHTIQI